MSSILEYKDYKDILGPLDFSFKQYHFRCSVNCNQCL